jgi:pimeloyl-ACP methyl ester carboxylesterase
MAEVSSERGEVRVAGAAIAWRAWGPRRAPAVLLVHGGAANQHWWDPVVPGLGDRERIVTLDLSGHGASGHRARYDAVMWARELAAVIEQTTRGHAAVVAHSMGGRVALAAAPALGDRLEGLVLVDTPIELPPDPELHRRLRQARKVYGTRAEAVDAFRVVPGFAARPEIARQVAAASVASNDDGGWLYRGDPAVVGRIPDDAVLRGIADSVAPVRVIRGEDSPFDAELRLDLLQARPGGVGRVIVLEAAGHHPMLDDPDSLATAIRAQLADLTSPSPTGTH